MAEQVRFIRRGGRVIPIKTGSGYGSSKRYGAGKKQPEVKPTSKGTSAVMGTLMGAAAKKTGFSLAGSTLVGLASYAYMRSFKTTTRAKGESNQQTARRVAMGNKAYNAMLKKGRK